MSITHTVLINCTAEHLFGIYKDVDSWAVWDPDIEAVGLDGEFAAGTRGWLKPHGAPRTKTILTEVREPKSFTVESRLPLCAMIFEHTLVEGEQGTSATHTVHFKGALAPLFSRLIGGKIRGGIDGTLQGLKAYAER